jgi:hypothetical protein
MSNLHLSAIHQSGCPTLAKPGWGIVCGSKRPPSAILRHHRATITSFALNSLPSPVNPGQPLQTPVRTS